MGFDAPLVFWGGPLGSLSLSGRVIPPGTAYPVAEKPSVKRESGSPIFWLRCNYLENLANYHRLNYWRLLAIHFSDVVRRVPSSCSYPATATVGTATVGTPVGLTICVPIRSALCTFQVIVLR